MLHIQFNLKNLPSVTVNKLIFLSLMEKKKLGKI